MPISRRTGNVSSSVSRAREQRVQRAPIVKSVIAGLLTLCTLSLSLSASCIAKDSTEAAQNEIRAALEKWTRDFNARNSSQVCSLFAPDPISNYQGQPEGNYDSLCARLKRSLDDPAKIYHYDLHIDEVLVAGELAVVRIKWTYSSIYSLIDPFQRYAEGRMPKVLAIMRSTNRTGSVVGSVQF